MQALLDNYEITWVSDNYLKFKIKKKEESTFVLDSLVVGKCSNSHQMIITDDDINTKDETNNSGNSNNNNNNGNNGNQENNEMDIDIGCNGSNSSNSSSINNGNGDYTMDLSGATFNYQYSAKTFLGTRAENQDTYFHRYYENYNIKVIGVFDGHGDGDASRPTANITSKYITNLFNQNQVELNNPKFYSNCISISLNKANEELLKEKNSDFGTTATIAFVTDKNKVIVGWIGDSTAVLFRLQKDGSYRGEYLSRDHKPEDSLEKERIIQSGGRVVFRSGSYRVIPKQGHFSVDEIKKKKLALNMSRSLGHSTLSQYGVSPLPEFSETSIESGDFLILASDGLWNVLELDVIAKMLCKYNSNNSIKDLSGLLIDSVDKKCKQLNSQCDNTTICCYKH